MFLVCTYALDEIYIRKVHLHKYYTFKKKSILDKHKKRNDATRKLNQISLDVGGNDWVNNEGITANLIYKIILQYIVSLVVYKSYICMYLTKLDSMYWIQINTLTPLILDLPGPYTFGQFIILYLPTCLQHITIIHIICYQSTAHLLLFTEVNICTASCM